MKSETTVYSNGVVTKFSKKSVTLTKLKDNTTGLAFKRKKTKEEKQLNLFKTCATNATDKEIYTHLYLSDEALRALQITLNQYFIHIKPDV